jgi:hypothetical protein
VRISVECGGFTRAADACLTANHVSALAVDSLARRLAGSSGMAGNDATSVGFARAYDEGAREALGALADLTHAFIGVARLLAATGERHAAAEAAAAGVTVSAYAAGHLDDSFVRVQPPAPPSSLGHQEPSLGPVDAWILDHVEGFVWPGADVERLRAAAADWRRAAAATAGLADQVDAAVALVEEPRSPEVPLAVDAMTDLGVLIGDTAWQLASLATSCEEYADAVEDVHARTRALLAEVAQMVVEGAAISVVVTGLSGGLGGGAAAAAAAARIRTQAPRFYALLAGLRAPRATAVGRVERVAGDHAAARTRLERFLRVPARGETGSMKPPTGWVGRGRVPARPRPEVKDGKLKNYVDQLFKGVAQDTRTGDGTTMDAIRHELASNELVHGKDHVRKGREILRGLERWLRTRQDASDRDREVAQDLADELKELLG